MHEAKLGHTAVSSVGERGTMDRLCKLGLLTILESASFGDHVYIRCFNGIHYASTTPVVRVKEIDEDVVTICDESANPTLDRGGRVCFGRVDRKAEEFVIVTHSRWLCGATTSYDSCAVHVILHEAIELLFNIWCWPA